MSEPQAAYILNPHYQEWVLNKDIEEDEIPEQEHRHAWNLDYTIGETSDDGFVEVDIMAWCQCEKTLSQREIETILNRFWGTA